MNLNSELQTLRTENMTLKQKLLNTQITKESFEGNDKNVLYMTGLPSYVTLIALFDIIQPHVRCWLGCGPSQCGAGWAVGQVSAVLARRCMLDSFSLLIIYLQIHVSI